MTVACWWFVICVNYHGDLCKRVNHVGPYNGVISCLCKRAERFRHGNSPTFAIIKDYLVLV